jgi:MFS family permease
MHSAYLWVHALATPLWVLYNLLPYILYKDLGATPLQITTLVVLKPLVSLLAIYWGEAINQRPDRLLANVIWARLLSLLPFFLFPLVDNVWYFVAASAFYMLLHRGVIPAWMEILKLNLPKASMGKTFAAGSLIGYVGNTLSPFLIGWLLDDFFQAWRWLFPITALISLSSILICTKISIPEGHRGAIVPLENAVGPLWDRLVAPWKVPGRSCATITILANFSGGSCSVELAL